MNKSIITVSEDTINEKVRALAETLIDNRNKMMKAVFIKKDGSERTMKFVPKFEHHELFGYETTPSGRKMVATKAARDMITVNEYYTPEGVTGMHDAIRARTINLRTIISLEVI